MELPSPKPNLKACGIPSIDPVVSAPILDNLPPRTKIAYARLGKTLFVFFPGEAVFNVARGIEQAVKKQRPDVDTVQVLSVANDYLGYVVDSDDFDTRALESCSHALRPRQCDSPSGRHLRHGQEESEVTFLPVTPGVEAHVGFGLALLEIPALPRYTLVPAIGATLTGSEARYTALYAHGGASVPYEMGDVTLSGGLSLTLFPGNASLSLAPVRGPDARYFCEYSIPLRVEFEPVKNDDLRIGFSAGLSLAGSRADYTDISIRTFEPRAVFAGNVVFSGFEIMAPSYSPELQFALEGFPVGGTFKTVDRSKASPQNGEDRFFRAGPTGQVTGYAASAAVGVHHANEPPAGVPDKRPLAKREGAIVVGASLSKRTYRGFVVERTAATRTGPGDIIKRDGNASVTAFFLGVRGFLP